MTTPDIAGIRERANRRTPGRWRYDNHPQEPIIESYTRGEAWESFTPVCQVVYGDYTSADAEFIANAPADITTLLDANAELAERVRTLEAALTILEREQHAYIATQTAFDDVWDAARKLRGDLTGDYTMEGGKDAIVIVIESARYTLRKQAADAGNGGA